MKHWVVTQCGTPVRIYGSAADACRWLKERLFTATRRRRKSVRIRDFEVQEWSRGVFRWRYSVRVVPHFAEIELCGKRP
jgi:hypothetical protein